MRVAVIDVGSNTIRLLVAESVPAGLSAVLERKARVGLGAEVELLGRISRAKLAETSLVVRSFAQEARELGCAHIEVAVASPGRQASNAGRLVRELARSTAAPVRGLSSEEEARLAYRGAIEAEPPLADSVAVCDVGGGSTQIAYGEPGKEPAWVRSVDIGSLRLAARAFSTDPPSRKAVAEATHAVQEAFSGLASPLPKQAYAVGGSARALRKVLGDSLGAGELQEALRILRKRTGSEITAEYGIEPGRAATLVAGTIILAEVQRRLGVPLRVVRAGLREGLALSMLEESSRFRRAAGAGSSG